RGRGAAELVRAEVAVASHDGDDGQAVERDAVQRAVRDPPGHDRFAAGRLTLASENAAAGVDLGGADFDVIAGNGGAGRPETESGRQQDGRERKRSFHREYLSVRLYPGGFAP